MTAQEAVNLGVGVVLGLLIVALVDGLHALYRAIPRRRLVIIRAVQSVRVAALSFGVFLMGLAQYRAAAGLVLTAFVLWVFGAFVIAAAYATSLHWRSPP